MATRTERKDLVGRQTDPADVPPNVEGMNVAYALETESTTDLYNSDYWARFDRFVESLAMLEMYLDEALEPAAEPLMDPWLDDALELRVASL